MENEKRMEDLKMRNNKDGAAAALQPKKIAVINDIGRLWPLCIDSGYSCDQRIKGTVLSSYHGSAVEPRRISILLF